MIGGTINVNEDWKIAVDDELNFVLRKKVVSKKGNERWDNAGFYADLEVLCLDLRDNMIRGHEFDSIDRLIEVVRESTSEIKTALGESPLLDGVRI